MTNAARTHLLFSALLATATCFVHRPPCPEPRRIIADAKCAIPASAPRGLRCDYLLSLERPSTETDDGGDVAEDRAPSEEESDEGGLTAACGDPYAPGVAEAYGLIDSTGTDGFDSSADAVGPGIYGGSVRRDPTTGDVLTGAQHENHNHKPGPLYDGGGYSLTSRAIHAGEETVERLLSDYPQLVEEVSTGGARPLHVCGMSPAGQRCARIFIDAGADVRALDTYGYNALHRMASNDLDVGAEALVRAGLDPNEKAEEADSTPIEIAKRQRAIKFLMAMQRLGHYD